jgi:FecR protein
MPGGGALAALCLVAMLSVTAAGTDRSQRATAVPGTLNYVEGQAAIGSETLNPKSIGSAELESGQSLTTENGKAEVLLTPGVFLRLGNDSSAKMISPGLTHTEVRLEQGHAIVEVDEIHPENNIRIAANAAITELLKTGLYDFDQRSARLRVFDGEAYVLKGDEHSKVKGGHEINLAAEGKLKTYRFDKKKTEEGDLFRWSSLRSSYLAEANVDAAGLYAENGFGPWGPGWWGADWYWDPWFDTFTFIPGDGIFYSPFGWGFYSPWLIGYAPLWGYGGYGHHPTYHFSESYRNWGTGDHYAASPGYANGIYRGPGSAGGFRSGPRGLMGSGRGFARWGGLRAGGVHGGGIHGGFQGGGFHGGGFHGGIGFSGSGGFHGR